MRSNRTPLPQNQFGKLRLLGAVLAACLTPLFNTQGVLSSANDVVTNARQVANTTTTNKNDRVFLQVVAFARNVNGNFFATRETNASNFSKSRVRFLRGHCLDLQANPLFERRFFQNGRFGKPFLRSSLISNQLINSWHSEVAICLSKANFRFFPNKIG